MAKQTIISIDGYLRGVTFSLNGPAKKLQAIVQFIKSLPNLEEYGGVRE